jgi:DNA (cytosine-5)-methyltransferase 1
MGSEAEGSRWEASTARQEPGAGSAARWGDYAPAINRWEHVIGRCAPSPTIQRAGRDRLNPVFVEWMMGLPEGWVTGHGLSASQELKMLGNGVVPQQAALALRLLGAA